ncbi:MAG: replication initiation protein, partial [Clostridiaceae bacterium]|nr:replication initiation protein [Clostridiaceae bacterium]
PAGQDTNIWESEMVDRLKKDPSQFKKRPIRDYLKY